MKIIAKLSLITASFAALVGTAAFADDPQLQNRLAIQRAQVAANQAAFMQESTVAVYSHRRGIVARDQVSDQSSESHLELQPVHNTFLFRAVR